MLDPALLKILCCPQTHQPLRPAPASLVDMLNRQIDAGQLRNAAGALVARKLDGGLVREDARMLYPVRGRLPVLLWDEAIPLA
jgi:uncharacterized protein YbaR (Trm112 family)